MDALQAFAEPRRRRILRLVHKRELTAGEIASRFKVTGPAISQHLRILRKAGLVTLRCAGTRRLYSLRAEGLQRVRAYVDEFWSEGLDRLKELVEEDTGRSKSRGRTR